MSKVNLTTILNFDVTPWQRILSVINTSYRYDKRKINNELTCNALMNIGKGQKFALCSPKGVRVFKCISIEEE